MITVRQTCKLLYLILSLSSVLSACTDNQPFIANDVTPRVERLGNPYQDRYRDGESVYARNIWDMQSYQGALFIGAGNSSNIGPAQNAGPVPIIRFDPMKQTFIGEGNVDDEQIDVFQINDDQLYIPGHDPRQNWDWGNFYHREKNGTWVKHRNIPGGLHAYSLAWHQGKFFGAIGIIEGAAVSISDDKGKSWTVTPIGRSRTYGFLLVANKLYATKRFPSSAQWKKLSVDERTQNYAVYEFIQPNKFVVRDDITHETLFPRAKLQPKQATKVVRSLATGEKNIYIGAYTHNDHQFLPFGIFVASSLEKGHIKVEKIPLPEEDKPWDLLLNGGYLYVLTSIKHGGDVKVRVLRSPVNNLANLSEVLEFTAKTFARSFEILGNDFYFGLGSEIENPEQWRQEELNPETGQILRIRNVLPKIQQ